MTILFILVIWWLITQINNIKNENSHIKNEIKSLRKRMQKLEELNTKVEDTFIQTENIREETQVSETVVEPIVHKEEINSNTTEDKFVPDNTFEETRISNESFSKEFKKIELSSFDDVKAVSTEDKFVSDNIFEETRISNESFSKEFKKIELSSFDDVKDNYKKAEYETSGIFDFFKQKEEIIGKYLIGAMGTLLLFIATILFVILIWNKVTPVIKISIITTVGFILTIAGMARIKTDKGSISSILLGSGAGILYISILSSNILFKITGNSITIVLCSIWSIFFILSSKYTDLFFTTIIAYIGSYIGLILGLLRLDYKLMFLFVTVISITMMYSSYKKENQFLTSITLSGISFITFAMGIEEQILIAITLVIIYLILNLIYKLIQDKTYNFAYSLVCTAAFIVTAIIKINKIIESSVSTFLILFIIAFVQFMLNRLYNNKMEQILDSYYGIMMAISFVLLNGEVFNLYAGLIIVSIIVMIKYMIIKKECRYELIIAMSILDLALNIFTVSGSIMITIYILLNIAAFTYSLYKLRKEYNISILKMIYMGYLIISTFAITNNIIFLIFTNYYTFNICSSVGSMVVIVILYLLYISNYFRNWKNKEVYDHAMGEFITGITLFMSILISFNIYFTINMGIHIPNIIFLYLIALLQTLFMYSKHKFNMTTKIMIIVKYSSITLFIICLILKLNIDMIAYLIPALMIGVAEVYSAFMEAVIRQYSGLIEKMILGSTLVIFLFVTLNLSYEITHFQKALYIVTLLMITALQSKYMFEKIRVNNISILWHISKLLVTFWVIINIPQYYAIFNILLAIIVVLEVSLFLADSTYEILLDQALACIITVIVAFSLWQVNINTDLGIYIMAIISMLIFTGLQFKVVLSKLILDNKTKLWIGIKIISIVWALVYSYFDGTILSATYVITTLYFLIIELVIYIQNKKTLDYQYVMIISTLIYITGIYHMNNESNQVLHFVSIISTVIVAMIQTKNIKDVNMLQDTKYSLWFATKYLLLIWSILYSYYDTTISTIVYSVVGLIFAVYLILIGFKWALKVVRQYGLVLAIVMVLKFIIIDLLGENSITRILAFIMGSILCFIISIIYNKISKNYETGE